MKTLVENRKGGVAVCPTCVEFRLAHGKLLAEFRAERSDLSSACVGRNAPLFEGNVVEVFVGSRARYLEVEVAPNGSLFTAMVDNHDGSLDLTYLTDGVTATVTTRDSAYDVRIGIDLGLLGGSADGLLINAFRIEMLDGADGPQTLFAMSPTLCGTFHRPSAFVPIETVLDGDEPPAASDTDSPSRG